LKKLLLLLKIYLNQKCPIKQKGGIARTIFKIIYDAPHFTKATPKSILILLDFASYIEKIHEWLGGYIVPIYIGEPKGLVKLV
jgi:hypothetical protein